MRILKGSKKSIGIFFTERFGLDLFKDDETFRRFYNAKKEFVNQFPDFANRRNEILDKISNAHSLAIGKSEQEVAELNRTVIGPLANEQAILFREIKDEKAEFRLSEDSWIAVKKLFNENGKLVFSMYLNEDEYFEIMESVRIADEDKLEDIPEVNVQVDKK